jgi:hypothetical protein
LAQDVNSKTKNMAKKYGNQRGGGYRRALDLAMVFS